MNNVEISIREFNNLPLEWNYDEVKNWLVTNLEVYKNLIVTEDNLSEAKADRAKLNALAKTISDKRIEVKKKYLAPFEEFENQMKELTSLCNEANSNIAEQINFFDNKRKEEKLAQIRAYFTLTVGELASVINFDSVVNPKWTNASYKLETIYEELEEIFGQVMRDVEVIKSLESGIDEELLNEYVRSGRNLAAVIKKNTEYQKMKTVAIKSATEEIAPQYVADGDDLFTVAVQITGTKAQLSALKTFIKTNGMRMERA